MFKYILIIIFFNHNNIFLVKKDLGNLNLTGNADELDFVNLFYSKIFKTKMFLKCDFEYKSKILLRKF